MDESRTKSNLQDDTVEMNDRTSKKNTDSLTSYTFEPSRPPDNLNYLDEKMHINPNQFQYNYQHQIPPGSSQAPLMQDQKWCSPHYQPKYPEEQHQAKQAQYEPHYYSEQHAPMFHDYYPQRGDEHMPPRAGYYMQTDYCQCSRCEQISHHGLSPQPLAGRNANFEEIQWQRRPYSQSLNVEHSLPSDYESNKGCPTYANNNVIVAQIQQLHECLMKQMKLFESRFQSIETKLEALESKQQNSTPEMEKELRQPVETTLTCKSMPSENLQKEYISAPTANKSQNVTKSFEYGCSSKEEERCSMNVKVSTDCAETSNVHKTAKGNTVHEVQRHKNKHVIEDELKQGKAIEKTKDIKNEKQFESVKKNATFIPDTNSKATNAVCEEYQSSSTNEDGKYKDINQIRTSTYSEDYKAYSNVPHPQLMKYGSSGDNEPRDPSELSPKSSEFSPELEMVKEVASNVGPFIQMLCPAADAILGHLTNSNTSTIKNSKEILTNVLSGERETTKKIFQTVLSGGIQILANEMRRQDFGENIAASTSLLDNIIKSVGSAQDADYDDLYSASSGGEPNLKIEEIVSNEENNGNNVLLDRQKNVTDETIKMLSIDLTSSECQAFCRALGLEDAIIEDVRTKNRNLSSEGKRYALLRKWAQTCGKGATNDNVIEGLLLVKREDIIKILFPDFVENDPEKSVVSEDLEENTF